MLVITAFINHAGLAGYNEPLSTILSVRLINPNELFRCLAARIAYVDAELCFLVTMMNKLYQFLLQRKLTNVQSVTTIRCKIQIYARREIEAN